MPIRSMTAYASGEMATEGGALGCELRAVNHRFLEVAVRLPDELRALEPAIRERIAERVSRGKLDFVLRLRGPEGSAGLRLDEDRTEALAALARDLHARFPMLRVDFSDLLQVPGLVQGLAVAPEALQAAAMGLVDDGLRAFVQARERDGAQLAAVITERVDGIARVAAEVRELVPVIRAAQRTRLEARLADLAHPVEPGRMEQELVLSLQKLDVDEELDRLGSHVVELRRTLVQDQPVGRRLDFLLQEFNREANTLGSKSVDARTSAAAVELKVLIDQVREQVQNIE